MARKDKQPDSYREDEWRGSDRKRDRDGWRAERQQARRGKQQARQYADE